MDKLSQAVFVWGVLLLFGFSATQFMLMPSSVNVLWIVLTVVGQLMLLRAANFDWKEPTFLLWTGVLAAGVVVTHLLSQGYFSLLATYASSVWLVLMAVPMLLTGQRSYLPLITHIGIGWLVAAVLIAVLSPLYAYQWLVTGLVTGLPMLYLSVHMY